MSKSDLLELFAKGELELAVQLLKDGELVAFPTETVYGLGADASNPTAVAKIFETKGRPADHPVIVHLGRSEDIKAWAKDIPEQAWQLAEAFWPGPLTLILKKQEHVLNCVTGNQDSVGLRIPSHPVAQALLQAFQGGVAAPSANRFGHISPTRAEHVQADFPDSLSLILDGGDSEVGLESTIVDLTSPNARLLRPGGIPLQDLQRVLPSIEYVAKKKTESTEKTKELRASGLLDKHYAPKVKTYLIEDALAMSQQIIASDENYQFKSLGVIAFETERSQVSETIFKKLKWIQMPIEPESYAQELYSSMRLLEEIVDEIWIEAVPEASEWLAVRDRLGRATEHFPS